MKFEIGEKVRLKHVTDDDKNNSALTYLDKFKNYEGLTATIIERYNFNNTYLIQIDSKPQKIKCYYQEKWLEKLITYEAF